MHNILILCVCTWCMMKKKDFTDKGIQYIYIYTQRRGDIKKE